jgi:hypothetical protein
VARSKTVTSKPLRNAIATVKPPMPRTDHHHLRRIFMSLLSHSSLLRPARGGTFDGLDADERWANSLRK